MIRIEKPTTGNDAWTKIREDAVRARAKLIAAFEQKGKVEVDERLYKKYKSFLLELFNEKCAYCETNITTNQPGDVEHFRPKGQVVDYDFQPVRISHPKWGQIQHPGYFWLAYEWKNLLPSCRDCNSYRNHGHMPDSGAGKANRFPVGEFRASYPDEEENEIALLIDPCGTHPAEHLEFLADGKVAPKTKAGEATLDHLGLNRREPLVRARLKAFRDAKALFDQYCNVVVAENRESAKDLRDRLNEMWTGREPYTAMQRLAFETKIKHNKRFGINVAFPLRCEEE